MTSSHSGGRPGIATIYSILVMMASIILMTANYYCECTPTVPLELTAQAAGHRGFSEHRDLFAFQDPSQSLISPQSTPRPLPLISPVNNLTSSTLSYRRRTAADSAAPPCVVYIHAMVGVFKKKRGPPGATWGHGLDIALELLQLIGASKLAQECQGVHVGLVGAKHDLVKARKELQLLNDSTTLLSSKLHIAFESTHTHWAEFPTLSAMQEHSKSLAVHTQMLYIHTKGVRRNGIGDYPAAWRRYMAYFVIEHAEVCQQALSERFGYLTCGVLKQRGIYAGNYFWTTAIYLSQKRPPVNALEWSLQNRYAAEEYILGGPRKRNLNDEQSHYCIHHTHHDMQNCPTPREWYTDPSLLALRGTAGTGVANCFTPDLLPKNQSKADPASWCHRGSLPPLKVK